VAEDALARPRSIGLSWSKTELTKSVMSRII
jgi:hypothetical protein